jgi:hypothetical protein
MTRRVASAGVAAVAAVAAATLTAPALAQPIAPAQQLQGTFQMTGTLTVAQNVRGEHTGEVVQRAWTFTPLCATGPCATVRLARQRAARINALLLHAIAPDTYAGTGRFYAPLGCSGRIYRPGQAVPYTITVHVTAVTQSAAGPVASGLSATYVNRSRINLTPCIGVLGHDSASYTGQLATG